MAFLPQNQKLAPNASKLRKNLTPTEIIIWSHIRKKQIKNIQFYRQKIIGNYIVDFYAPAVKLVIEIDGSQHFEEFNIKIDKVRDKYLYSLGLTIFRFDNNQVNLNLNSVLEKIYDYIENFSR